MKKIIPFLLAGVLACGGAVAGDFRLCYVLPVNTTAITNLYPAASAARAGQLAIIASASAASVSTTVSIVTGQYTNSIPLQTSTAMSATSTAALSTLAPVCVQPGDSFVITATSTNTVPVYFYLSFVNGKALPPFVP